MATILTTLQDGVDQRLAEHVNIPGRALNGLLIADDNGGKLIVPVSLGFPFTFRSGAGTPQAKAFAPATTHTVAAGQFAYVTAISAAASATVQVDPSDAAAFAISNSAATAWHIHTGLCLQAGDALILPASAYAVGFLIDASALVGSPTRVLKEINNSAPYSVGAGKQALLSHVAPCTATGAVLTVDGAGAAALTAPGASGGVTQVLRLYAKAAQALASTGANFVVSGLEYSV
jgi:hypothetical protein